MKRRADRKKPSRAKRMGAKGVVGRPFPKGVSGNPGGRPKAAPELVSALQLGSMTALEIIWKRMHSRNETISLRAALGWLAKIVPDAAVLEITGAGGGPIAIETVRERLALALIKKFGPTVPQASVVVAEPDLLPEKT
jgi:hypothetical protein